MNAALERDELARILPGYLSRQRWFPDAPDGAIEVIASRLLREGWPGLVWALMAHEGEPDLAYQLLVGLRPASDLDGVLRGKEDFLLGEIDTPWGRAIAYDALHDAELALVWLGWAAPDVEARVVRPLTMELSNSSVVFDERLIAKLFRRVRRGPNPESELPEALSRVGFERVPTLRGVARQGDRDLAVVRDYLVGATDGWALAVTSLRDLFAGEDVAPEEAGGDMAPEVERLGVVIGELHAALAGALGVHPADPVRWAASLRARVDALPEELAGPRRAGVGEWADRLAAVADAGAAIRVHGDLWLTKVLRSDDGWYVFDFEGDPAVPIGQRRTPASALTDVASMLQSFDAAQAAVRREQGEARADRLEMAGHWWEGRLREAFLAGYHSIEGTERLLPVSDDDRRVVLVAHEIDAALRAVDRLPSAWSALDAIDRLTGLS